MPNEWFKGRNCLVPRLLCPIPYLAVFSAQLFSPFSRSWLCFTHNIFFLLFFILYKHTEAFRSIFSYLIPSLVMFYIITRSLLLSCPSRVKLKSIFYTLYFFFAITTHVFLCICDYYFSINAFKVVYVVERLFNHFLSVYLSVFFSPVWDPSKSL